MQPTLMLKKYAASLVWFVIGLFIILWQFVLPDPIPELVMNLIERDNSMFIGLDFTLKAFLTLYIVSGMISLIIGIVTAILAYRSGD